MCTLLVLLVVPREREDKHESSRAGAGMGTTLGWRCRDYCALEFGCVRLLVLGTEREAVAELKRQGGQKRVGPLGLEEMPGSGSVLQLTFVM